MNSPFFKLIYIFKSKDALTLYMNHLLVLYSFLLPISLYSSSFIFFIILTLFFIRRNFREYLVPVLKNRVVQAFILFYAMHIIWLLNSNNYSTAMQSINVVKYSLFPIIFLSFLDRNFSKYIISGFIAGMFFSELFSYLLQFKLIPWHFSFYNIPIYKASAYGDPSPFLNHSFYSSSLAFVSILLIYRLVKLETTTQEKIISLLLIITISINLTLIGGRIGYFLYIILILFLVAYIYKKKFLIPFIVFFAIVGSFFTLAYNFSPMFHSKVNQTTQTLQGFVQGEMDFTTSLGQRFGFWYYSVDIIKKEPLLGVGTGDYMDEVKAIIPESHNNRFLKNLEHPHNFYIQLLLQFGILGIIVFLNLLYKIAKTPANSDYMQFVKYAILITITIGLLTETFVYRYYLPLLVLIVSATITSKIFINSNKILFNKNTFLFYAIILLLATINAKLHFIIYEIKKLILG